MFWLDSRVNKPGGSIWYNETPVLEVVRRVSVKQTQSITDTTSEGNSLMKALLATLTICCALGTLLTGCSDPAEENPRLAYLVGYSLLDERFQTSTRLDLTADILNNTGEDLKMAQLVVTDMEGTSYTLDYETIPRNHQEGRYNAIPLKAPIANKELGGNPGVEFRSPGDLHFLFHVAFESAMIRFRNSDGLQEFEVKDLKNIVEQSRKETIAWMQKEYEEREKTLKDLQEKAQKVIDDRKSR